jgi:hypothetical protein
VVGVAVALKKKGQHHCCDGDGTKVRLVRHQKVQLIAQLRTDARQPAKGTLNAATAHTTAVPAQHAVVSTRALQTQLDSLLVHAIQTPACKSGGWGGSAPRMLVHGCG